MRLPEPYEWKLSCDNAGAWSLTSMTGNHEWASNEAVLMAYGTAQANLTATVFGLSDCDNSNRRFVGHYSSGEDSQTFRCVR